MLMMEMMKWVLGEENPHLLSSMCNISSTYRKQGQSQEARELGVLVMETRKRAFGEEH